MSMMEVESLPSYAQNMNEIMRESKQFIRKSMVKVKVPPKPYEPTKEERQSHEATRCPFRACCEICVKAKNPNGRQKKQLVDSEHIPVTTRSQQTLVEFPAGSFDGGCDGLNSRIKICSCGKERKGSQDDYVMQSFQSYIDKLGLVKAELTCDQEPL